MSNTADKVKQKTILRATKKNNEKEFLLFLNETEQSTCTTI